MNCQPNGGRRPPKPTLTAVPPQGATSGSQRKRPAWLQTMRAGRWEGGGRGGRRKEGTDTKHLVPPKHNINTGPPQLFLTTRLPFSFSHANPPPPPNLYPNAMPSRRPAAASLLLLLALSAATARPAPPPSPSSSSPDAVAPTSFDEDILPIHNSGRRLRVLGLALAGAAIAKLHANGECLFPGGPLCPFPDGGHGPPSSSATAVVNINSAGEGDAPLPPRFGEADLPPPVVPAAGEASANAAAASHTEDWEPVFGGKPFKKHHNKFDRFDGPPPPPVAVVAPPPPVNGGGSSSSSSAAGGSSAAAASGGTSTSAGAGPHGSATATAAGGGGGPPVGGGAAIKAEATGNGHATATVG